MRASVHYEFYPAEETRVAWRAYTQSTEVQQVTEEERVVATPPIFIQRQFNYDRDLYGLGVDVQQGMGDMHLIGYGVDINAGRDRKSTRLNSSHVKISYAVFCLKK